MFARRADAGLSHVISFVRASFPASKQLYDIEWISKSPGLTLSMTKASSVE